MRRRCLQTSAAVCTPGRRCFLFVLGLVSACLRKSIQAVEMKQQYSVAIVLSLSSLVMIIFQLAACNDRYGLRELSSWFHTPQRDRVETILLYVKYTNFCQIYQNLVLFIHLVPDSFVNTDLADKYEIPFVSNAEGLPTFSGQPVQFSSDAFDPVLVRPRISINIACMVCRLERRLSRVFESPFSRVNFFQVWIHPAPF